jgi:hypothetical protein
MADPATWGYVIYGALAATTAYGAVTTAQNQSANAKAQAQAQEYNAAVSANQAEAARRAASAKEDAFRQNSTQFLAKQRAAAAESGFDSGSGSTALMLQQSADSAELDALMIRHQGELEAHGYTSQAVIDKYGASVSRDNAGRAISSGYVNAASGLLSTAASYGRGGVKVA